MDKLFSDVICQVFSTSLGLNRILKGTIGPLKVHILKTDVPNSCTIVTLLQNDGFTISSKKTGYGLISNIPSF